MKFRRVTLQVEDPAPIARFYGETLGFPDESDEEGVAVRAGATRLAFVAVPGGARATYHFAFNIPGNKVAEAEEWLRSRIDLLQHEGRTIHPFPSWNAQALYFLDPAGNVVEFIARRNLAHDSVAAFGSASILCVSEVGIPCVDRAGFAHELEQVSGVRLWRGGTETFGALGDEHGLFILVPPTHRWFPTELPAVPHPVTVEIEGVVRDHVWADPQLRIAGADRELTPPNRRGVA